MHRSDDPPYDDDSLLKYVETRLGWIQHRYVDSLRSSVRQPEHPYAEHSQSYVHQKRTP